MAGPDAFALRKQELASELRELDTVHEVEDDELRVINESDKDGDKAEVNNVG